MEEVSRETAKEQKSKKVIGRQVNILTRKCLGKG